MQRIIAVLVLTGLVACASDGRYIPMASPAGFGAASKMPNGIVATAAHVWQAGAQLQAKSDRYDIGFYRGARGGAEWCDPIPGSKVTLYGTRPPGLAVKAKGIVVETDVWFDLNGTRQHMIAIRPRAASVKFSAAGYSGGPVVDKDGCIVAMAARQINGYTPGSSVHIGAAAVNDVLAYPKQAVYAEAERLGIF